MKQLHLFCLNTFLQSRALSVEFPEMMSEVIAAQLPKILAGMVKPLLFHKKWIVFSLIIEMISGSFFVCLFWSRFCNVRTSVYLSYLPCLLLYTCNIHKPFKLDVHIVNSWFLNCKNHNSHKKCFVNLASCFLDMHKNDNRLFRFLRTVILYVFLTYYTLSNFWHGVNFLL